MSRCQAATPEGAPGLQSRKSVNGMHLGSICPAVSGRIGSAGAHRGGAGASRGGAGAVPEVCTNGQSTAAHGNWKFNFQLPRRGSRSRYRLCVDCHILPRLASMHFTAAACSLSQNGSRMAPTPLSSHSQF